MFCQHASFVFAICFSILCFRLILYFIFLYEIPRKQNILMFINNLGGRGGGKTLIFKYILKCQDSLLSTSPILLSAHRISSGYIEVNATVKGAGTSFPLICFIFGMVNYLKCSLWF